MNKPSYKKVELEAIKLDPIFKGIFNLIETFGRFNSTKKESHLVLKINNLTTLNLTAAQNTGGLDSMIFLTELTQRESSDQKDCTFELKMFRSERRAFCGREPSLDFKYRGNFDIFPVLEFYERVNSIKSFDKPVLKIKKLLCLGRSHDA